MNTKNVFIVTLTSLAVGAALGILFAPDKGTNLRKKISRKGEDLIDNLKGKFDDFICDIKDQIQATTEDAEDLLDDAKGKARQAKNDMKSELKNALS